ncbi:hypothetical protein Aduo_013296 [Ancylostoma duodenale]
MGSFASLPPLNRLRSAQPQWPMVPPKMLVAVLPFDDDGCLDRSSQRSRRTCRAAVTIPPVPRVSTSPVMT